LSLPMAHGLTGVGIHLLCRDKNDRTFRLSSLAFAFLVPILPDLDFLLEWFLPCSPVICRRSYTHSLPLSLAFGLAAGGIIWLFEKSRRGYWKSAAYSFLLYYSHPVIDMLGGPNMVPPSGVMLLHPFSRTRLYSQVPFLPQVPVQVTGPGILWEHLGKFMAASLKEAALLLPVLLIIFLMRRYHRRPIRLSWA